MMRTVIGAVIAGLLIGAVASAAQTGNGAAIPKEARKALDKKWPGWTLAEVDPQATSCLPDGQRPQFVTTDLDGDGRPDAGIVIKTSTGVRLVALMSRADRYDIYDIDSLGDQGVRGQLGVEHRGTKYINPRTKLDEYFSSDTLTVFQCPDGRTSYFWTGVGFRKMVISVTQP